MGMLGVVECLSSLQDDGSPEVEIGEGSWDHEVGAVVEAALAENTVGPAWVLDIVDVELAEAAELVFGIADGWAPETGLEVNSIVLGVKMGLGVGASG